MDVAIYEEMTLHSDIDGPSISSSSFISLFITGLPHSLCPLLFPFHLLQLSSSCMPSGLGGSREISRANQRSHQSSRSILPSNHREPLYQLRGSTSNLRRLLSRLITELSYGRVRLPGVRLPGGTHLANQRSPLYCGRVFLSTHNSARGRRINKFIALSVIYLDFKAHLTSMATTASCSDTHPIWMCLVGI